jgi:hypothetical protein
VTIPSAEKTKGHIDTFLSSEIFMIYMVKFSYLVNLCLNFGILWVKKNGEPIISDVLFSLSMSTSSGLLKYSGVSVMIKLFNIRSCQLIQPSVVTYVYRKAEYRFQVAYTL